MTWSTSVFALWVSFNFTFLSTDSEVYDSNVQRGKGTTIRPNLAQKKICIHALWLHPAAPFRIHFGFLSVVMVTSGTGGATTKCLHWMTAAEARAAWNGVFSKGDRVVPERPARTRGAQKSTSTSWKCHAPGKWGLPLEPMLFLRTAFINVAPLHVAFTPSSLTRSQGARSMD